MRPVRYPTERAAVAVVMHSLALALLAACGVSPVARTVGPTAAS